jgi:formiminotetrahydrofolate cyclodeaminase
MSFSDITIRQFLDELASPSPSPSGGSAAAFSGALGAALIAMVCRLTIGKKNYEEASLELQAIIPRAEEKRRVLLELIDADAAAYEQVIAKYRLPRETEEQKAARTEAIQQALKDAADIPYQIAAACAAVLDMVLPVAAKGNKNAESDAGAAAMLAEAGLRAAALNVEINLGLIKDAQYVTEMRNRLEPLTRGRAEQKDAIVRVVESRI